MNPATTVVEAPRVVASGEAQRTGIRPFTRADIPAVVALRYQIFRHTARPSAAELGHYLGGTFLDSPWRSLDLPSLVHVDTTGAVDGFVGVVPRPMRFQGRLLRVAVPTQLMMRPGAAPGSGLRLARAIFDGPQDLMISDTANDAARRIWDRVGGCTSIAHSIYWTLPLRPARHALAPLAASAPGRTLAFLLRPACRVIDGLRAAPARADGPPLTTEPFDPVEQGALLPRILAPWPVHTVYDANGLAWQLGELRRKRDLGPLDARLVRDARGEVIGWFLYFANRGGVGEVVQLGAHPGDIGRILGPLIACARAAGVVALAGRMEPTAAATLAAHGAALTRNGPWFLTHSRDPALLAEILRGGAALSRLEGEWWLNF